MFLKIPKGDGVKGQSNVDIGGAVPWRNAILVEHTGEYRRNGDYGCTNADYLCVRV